MQIEGIRDLAIPEVKVIKFRRFTDDRGYFTEQYRRSDLIDDRSVGFLKGESFVQANESFSHKNTFRGLHFQWNPYMGKLVRTLYGNLIDFALDIRKGSPTLGRIIAYELPEDSKSGSSEWIWVPPGFAHGILLTEESLIEYFCTGEYSPGCEASISPIASDIDWSLCDGRLKDIFDGIVPDTELITEKDKNGFSVSGWLSSKDSDEFIYNNK